MSQSIIKKIIRIILAVLFGTRIKKLSGKKVMMFGPPMSGKTTFKDWLIDGKPKDEYHQTGIEEGYNHFHDDENCIDFDILDRGGHPEFLTGVGQSLYESHDVILLFFNVSKYIADNEYKNYVNALFDNLATLFKNNSKPILIIGSYKDMLTQNRLQDVSLVNLVDSSKWYYQFLCGRKFIPVNTKDKNDIVKILKEMKKLIKN